MGTLDQYLSQVDRALRSIPASERRLEIQEIRIHLQQMVAANLEHGESPEDAELSATRRFGSAQMVGRTLVNSWYRRAGLLPGSVAKAVLSVLVWTFACLLAPIVVEILLASTAGPQALSPGILVLILCWIAVVPPLAAGCISTLLNPGCPAVVTPAVLTVVLLLLFVPLFQGPVLFPAIAVSWLIIGTLSSMAVQHCLGARAHTSVVI